MKFTIIIILYSVTVQIPASLILLFVMTYSEPTIVRITSENQTVNASDDIRLDCHAITDPDEMSTLEVTWLYEGLAVDYTSQQRFTFNTVDFSLSIANAEVDDSGVYACHATSGLDKAESDPVFITVRRE